MEGHYHYSKRGNEYNEKLTFSTERGLKMVKKVFTILGTAVGAIIAIAIIINVILPNGIAGLSNNVELAIQQATGANIDFNGDGVGGSAGNAESAGKEVDSLDESGLSGFNGEITGN